MLIAWRGASKGEDTWEPVEDIKQQFPKFHLEDKVFFRGGSDDTNPTDPKWGRVYRRIKKKSEGKGECANP